MNTSREKKRHPLITLLMLAIIGAGLCFILAFVVVFLGTLDGSPSTYEVEYIVNADADADLTLENESGATEQITVSPPWKKTFTAERGQFLYVSAQIDGEGEISCRLIVDGVIVQSAESDGRFVIATCSGRAGQ